MCVNGFAKWKSISQRFVSCRTKIFLCNFPANGKLKMKIRKSDEFKHCAISPFYGPDIKGSPDCVLKKNSLNWAYALWKDCNCFSLKLIKNNSQNKNIIFSFKRQTEINFNFISGGMQFSLHFNFFFRFFFLLLSFHCNYINTTFHPFVEFTTCASYNRYTNKWKYEIRLWNIIIKNPRQKKGNFKQIIRLYFLTKKNFFYFYILFLFIFEKVFWDNL